MIPPAPVPIPGYPRSLYILPLVIIALGPVWWLALIFDKDLLVAIVSPFLVGYAVAQAVIDLRKMRRDEREWSEVSEGYRRWWLKRFGS